MTADYPMASGPRRLRLALALGLLASVALGLRAQQVPDARKPRGLMRPPAGAGAKAPAAPQPGRGTAAAGGGGSLPKFRAGKLLGGQGTPRPMRGLRTVDIRDFGAVPHDHGAAAANSLAIQRAHDALCYEWVFGGGANPEGYRGVVFIPSGTWFLQWPVWIDGDWIDVIGEGSSSILSTGPIAAPLLILGRKRATAWRAGGLLEGVAPKLSPNNRVDMSTLTYPTDRPVGGPDRRWALRSRQSDSPSPYADHYIQFVAIPPATGDGDGWRKLRKFSLSFSFSAGNGGPVHNPAKTTNDALCGFGANPGNAPNRTMPWVLMAGDATTGPDGKYHFYFVTEEGNGDFPNYSHREIAFGDTTKVGVQEVELEMDLTRNDSSGSCYFAAYVNGVQVAVERKWGAVEGWGASFKAADNLHFRGNDYAPFDIFAWGGRNSPNFGTTQVYDGIFCGMRFCRELRYRDRGPGQAQQRIDGGPVSSYIRYFAEADGPDADKTICLVPLTDKPHETDRTSDKFITVRTGRGDTGYGMFFEDVDEVSYHLVKGNRIKHIRLESNRDVPMGCAVYSAMAFDSWIENCDFRAGWYGMFIVYGYDHVIRDCVYTGRDAGLVAHSALMDVDGIRTRETVLGTLMTLVGCNMEGRRFKTGNMDPGCDYLFKLIGDSGYGNRYTIEGIETDQEGAPGPRKALIWCSQAVDAHMTRLIVKDVVSGGAPDDVPIVDLVSRPGCRPGHVQVEDITAAGKLAVRVHGSGWSGHVRDCIAPEVTEWIRNTGPGGVGRVVSHHDMDALPTTGTWAKGCNIIHILNPAPGKPSSYICSASGVGKAARWAPIGTLGTPVQAP